MLVKFGDAWVDPQSIRAICPREGDICGVNVNTETMSFFTICISDKMNALCDEYAAIVNNALQGQQDYGDGEKIAD